MRYWFDTEFIEDGKTIDLISIGIVAEDGREYYAINYNCNFEKANQWVKDNVLSQLPAVPMPYIHKSYADLQASFAYQAGWRSRPLICDEVLRFCGGRLSESGGFELIPGTPTPEFWAYYADYDWVVFCQLFGTMMDLPKGFPMYCHDIKQECDRLGNPELPEQNSGLHDALEDARWNKKAWEFLQRISNS